MYSQKVFVSRLEGLFLAVANSPNRPTFLIASPPVLDPETFCTILSYLSEDSDLYSTSLVCTAWSELSLDHLWKKMHSLFPLLQILAPMAHDEDAGTWVSIQAESGHYSA